MREAAPMPEPELEGLTNFLYEMGLLKRYKRTGWMIAGIDNPESIAEHSFRTAIIGYLLAVMEGADPGGRRCFVVVVVVAMAPYVHTRRRIAPPLSVMASFPAIVSVEFTGKWRVDCPAARGTVHWGGCPYRAHRGAGGRRGMSVTIADIEAARRTIAGQVLRTPMLPAPKLSALTGAEVFVKYENLQVTNSFKERGALNKLASLGDAERARGVIAMSAGNHAQAVAYHAARLRHSGHHRDAGDDAVREGGGDAGATAPRWCSTARRIADAQVRAEAIARERDLIWVHPYDDPRVIAGQGTIALEMLEEVPDLDAAGDPDRRRRTDRRQRDGGAGDQAVDRDRRRRGRALSVVLERLARRAPRRSAGRRWRKASRSRMSASSRCRSCASSSPRSCWSTRRISSARSTPI